jgi:hypothetical protein
MSGDPVPGCVDGLVISAACDDAVAIALLEAGLATLRRARESRTHLQELSPTDRQTAIGQRHRVLDHPTEGDAQS